LILKLAEPDSQGFSTVIESG